MKLSTLSSLMDMLQGYFFGWRTGRLIVAATAALAHGGYTNSFKMSCKFGREFATCRSSGLGCFRKARRSQSDGPSCNTIESTMARGLLMGSPKICQATPHRGLNINITIPTIIPTNGRGLLNQRSASGFRFMRV